MKILIINILVFLSLAVNAQEKFTDKKPEERAGILTEWMQQELKLDSTVIKNVYNINLKYAIKMEELKNGDAGRRSKFRKAKSIAKNKDSDLKKIFSSEQFRQYQDKKKEMRNHFKNYKSEQ